jgi:hypothetical protein
MVIGLRVVRFGDGLRFFAAIQPHNGLGLGWGTARASETVQSLLLYRLERWEGVLHGGNSRPLYENEIRSVEGPDAEGGGPGGAAPCD